MITYQNIKDIQKLCREEKLEFWKVVELADAEERGVPEEESFDMMSEMYKAMELADTSYDGSLRSASGLAGGDGEKLHRYNEEGKNICGPFISKVMEKAIKMGESNACMRRIVAAPTAGSCGVIPAVFLTAGEELGIDYEQMIKAMYVAAGVGAVNAVTSAQMALAGIRSAIPVDEVIDAMRRIGNDMSPTIKETGLGGLATTPTAVEIGKRM